MDSPPKTNWTYRPVLFFAAVFLLFAIFAANVFDLDGFLDSKTSGMVDDWKNATSIYDFSAKDIDGNDVSLEKYRGHVCIIINVACKCGLTGSNYPQLQVLHEKFADSKGLRILGFPCNQFAGQEPWSEEEIKEFIKQYDVKFDMFSKTNVNGDDAHPLWKYLKSKQGGFLGSFIKWNFTKFLIDKQGQPVKRYGPNVNPSDIEKDLEAYW